MFQLNGYIDYLQQRNAITVLRALHHIENPRWSLVKDYAIQKLGTRSLSDYSYRRLCRQLVKLKLAEAVERGPLKRDYHLTELGHETAETIEEALIRTERWRVRAEREDKANKK